MSRPICISDLQYSEFGAKLKGSDCRMRYNGALIGKAGGTLIIQPHTHSESLLEILEGVETPALVYDQLKLESLLAQWLAVKELAGVKVLYAVKAAASPNVLEIFSQRLDGFAVSSPFEARFVRDLFPGVETHFTSPGIRPVDIPELGAYCDFISFNSRSQADRHLDVLSGAASLGVRVNTGISKVSDPRYDPCRPRSKLGVPINQLREMLSTSSVTLNGLHIHTNSDSFDYSELLENVHALCDAVPDRYAFQWVNLGGGYLLEKTCLEPLAKAVEQIKARFGAQVYIEPGAGLIRAAGYLVGSILDIFEVDGGQIAVLDTTVNHMPEVLEFDYQPDVVNQVEDGPFEYVLAGATCLAGDIFGTYSLPQALEVGQKVIFREAGAYTLTKSHRFNGVNLPSTWSLAGTGDLKIHKQYGFQHYKEQWLPDV